MGPVDRLLDQLDGEIDQVDPESIARLDRSVLIDIREREEVLRGSVEQAVWIARGQLETECLERFGFDRPIVLMCQSGRRSLLAAKSLEAIGYGCVKSLRGGFAAWKNSGLNARYDSILAPELAQRYGRQIALPEVGEEGQLTLARSSVLVVGLGGLGSPCALYLAAAGVGKIGLVDFDRVELSNLQRQIVYNEESVGKKKVEQSAASLRGLNSNIDVSMVDAKVSSDNAEEIVEGYDVVVDGTDNLAVRAAISDACLKQQRAFILGAVYRHEGLVSVFPYHLREESFACYRCQSPDVSAAAVPNCSEAGVVGVVPGVIGVLQAAEAIKVLLNIGSPIAGRTLFYDALSARFRSLSYPSLHECPHRQN